MPQNDTYSHYKEFVINQNENLDDKKTKFKNLAKYLSIDEIKSIQENLLLELKQKFDESSDRYYGNLTPNDEDELRLGVIQEIIFCVYLYSLFAELSVIKPNLTSKLDAENRFLRQITEIYEELEQYNVAYILERINATLKNTDVSDKNIENLRKYILNYQEEIRKLSPQKGELQKKEKRKHEEASVVSNSDVQNLLDQLTKKDDQIKQLNEIISALNSVNKSNDKLQKLYNDENKKVENLRKDLGAKNEQIAQLEQDFLRQTAASEQNSQLLAKYTENFSSQLTEEQTNLDKATLDTQKLQSKLVKEQEKTKALEEKLLVLRKDESKLKSEKSKLEEEAHKKFEDVEKNLQKSRGELEKLQENFNNLRKENDELKQQAHISSQRGPEIAQAQKNENLVQKITKGLKFIWSKIKSLPGLVTKIMVNKGTNTQSNLTNLDQLRPWVRKEADKDEIKKTKCL